jgi:hypothetical protein
MHNRAEVLVCGKPCSIVEDQSDSDQVTCEVPYIQSVKSIEEFTIEEEGPILGSILESSSGIGTLAFDGKNHPGSTDTGTSCYMGTMFEGDSSTHFVGILSELKFFMQYFSNKDTYNGNLVLQGSNLAFDDENATPTTILTVGEELHEGWNYYKFDEWGISTPKYRYYRLFNEVENGCDKIGEINFIGYKAVDSAADTHFCDVSLTSQYGDFDTQVLS